MSQTSTIERGSGTSALKERGFSVERERKSREKIHAETLRALTKALNETRKVFAVESSTKGKKIDSELQSFTAYENALNSYLTFRMQSQGFQMAEEARIGERDFLGAVDRAKNPKKFWGAIIGGGSLMALTAPLQTAVGVAAGFALNTVYKPLSRSLSDQVTWGTSKSKIENREREAKEASLRGVDFKTFTGSENLLDKNLGLKFKVVTDKIRRDRAMRLALSFATAGGTFLATGAGLSSNLIHDQVGNISAADWLAQHGMGWLVNGFRSEIAGGVSATVGAIVGGPANAAELSGIASVENGADIKTQLITRFGTAPWALTREAAFTPRSITEAADMLIRGGMNPEARQAFIDAATLQRTNATPDFIEFNRREWEAQVFKVRGVPQVLGDGADRVLFDASRDVSYRGGTPPLYLAEQFPFTYTDSFGVLHTVIIDVPQGRVVDGRQFCGNFSLFTDTSTSPSTPVPETGIPPPTPEATRVMARAVWSEQTGVIAQDCTDTCSENKVTTVRVLTYSGESIEEAREYMLASIRETSAWAGYQPEMRNKFAYFIFRNTLTGADTFACLQFDTNHFDIPQNVVNGRSIPVTTQAAFDGLVMGTGEEWKMSGMARGADISVLHPKDPIPLVEVRNSSGRLTHFAIGGEDTNADGILQRNEQGRSLAEVVNNQIFVVGNDIISQETGSPITNEAAQARLERVFLSVIPQNFIDGRTGSVRFDALQNAFGQSASRPDGLSRDELNELGRWIHFYGEPTRYGNVIRDAATNFTNPDGSPKVIFQFFKEGITMSAQPTDGSRGDFPDLRSN